MKTSARNTLEGTISKVTKGAVNSEVELTTKGGNKVVAIVTNHSAETLGLKAGVKACALIKASWVILGKDLHKVKLSTRNLFCGEVTEIHDGAVNAEIDFRLAGGEILTSIITEGSLKTLDLKVKEHVCGAVKASSVILAVE
ncbi:MAG: TOBE domain-containing protein [Acidobacteriota bacterium]|nr:TOBE domain-containing protein [Acidobacteriota bacterium]